MERKPELNELQGVNAARALNTAYEAVKGGAIGALIAYGGSEAMEQTTGHPIIGTAVKLGCVSLMAVHGALRGFRDLSNIDG